MGATADGFLETSTTSGSDSVIIRNMHVANNIITLADSEIIVMGTNIDNVVVAYDDIKYINWAIMKGVTSDGSFFES